MIATAELAGALTTTILSLLIPLIAFTATCLIAAWILWKILHRPAKPSKPAS